MDIHAALRPLDFSIVFLYIAAFVSFGIWISIRKRKAQDLFLGGRSLGWGNVGFSIWATNMGPWNLLGMCGIAYSTGIAAAAFDWLAWLGLLPLAMLFAPYYLHTRATTMPEFIRRRFGNNCHTFLSWYALLTNMIVWLGGTMYAGGLLISQIMGWPFAVSLIIMITISISFTAIGGLLAVAVTDTLQAIFIITTTIVLNIVLFRHAGGFGKVLEATAGGTTWQMFRSFDDPAFPAHALFLGVVANGIWFFCTDQTVVQRVLGARNLEQGQKGALLAAFLKILPPFLFMVPGIVATVLHPALKNPDEVYMTLVTQHLPVGLVGCVIAVVVAALVSTINSAVNSFATIFSLDIVVKYFRPQADEKEKRRIGQWTTVGAGVLLFFVCIWFKTLSKDLFNLIQFLISFFAPPLTALFLVGVLWKRATSKAAFAGLCIGTAVSLGLGICHYRGVTLGLVEAWPHYLLMAFYLTIGIAALMIVLSLVTRNSSEEENFPTLRETYAAQVKSGKTIWAWWGALAVVMLIVYFIF